MKLSIIVPVYKVEKYLARCLDSLLLQNLDAEDYEILLVDDASPDGSTDIAKTYAYKHPQINYFYKDNGGLGSARNFGMKQAKGDYILFVDSDDWLSEGVLQPLLSQAEDEQLDVLIFNIQRVFDNGKIISSEIEYTAGKLYSGETLLLQERLVVSPCINLFKRSMLLDHQIFFREGIFYEDIDFYLKSLLASQRVMYRPEVVYQYYCNDQSITMNKESAHHRKKIEDYGKAIIEIHTIATQQTEAIRQRIDYIKERYCRFWMQMLYRENPLYEDVKKLITKMKREGIFPFRIAQHTLSLDERAQLYYFNHWMFRNQYLFDKRYSAAVFLMKINKRIKVF